MNYQINNLNELKDRQASYSQSLKLPRSPWNNKVLGFLGIFDVESMIPYQAIPCIISRDGANLLPQGSVLLIDRVSRNTIECQVVSTSIDFFNQLENISITDSAFDLVWDMANLPANGKGQTSGGVNYAYLLSTVDKTSGSAIDPMTVIYSGGGYASIKREHLFPALPIIDTIRYLSGRLGYTLETDIEGEESKAPFDYFTCSRASVIGEGLPAFEAQAYGIASGGASGSAIPSPPVNSTMRVGPWGDGPSPSDAVTNSKYNGREAVLITSTGVSNITVVARTQAIGGGFLNWDNVRGIIYLNVVRPDGTTDEITREYYLANWGTEQTYEFDQVRLSDGDKLFISSVLTSVRQGNKLFSISVRNFIDIKNAVSQGTAPQIGDPINLLQSTGFSSPLDLFKAFLQIYGLTVYIDHDNNVVKAYTMDYLYKRIDTRDIVDWSDKILKAEENQWEFRLSNYAQRNIIKLKDNSRDNVQDSGVFNVLNESLSASKDLFTINIEAGMNVSGQIPAQQGGAASKTVTLANVPIYDVSQSSPYDRTFSGTTAHVVREDAETVILRVYRDTTYQLTTLPIAKHVPMQSYIDFFYNSLVARMLRLAKKITFMFNLTDFDIETLDLYKPVYIDHLGAYFYISKINNYISDQPTKCELIKL